jgi:quinol monooxygenase YgiN/catechol 2,3-dioxygenase-like lactoylglutathione lyase family enzyme
MASAPLNPTHGGIHHVKLPVTDLERSAAWYAAVLGAHRLSELDHRRPDGTIFAVILDVPGLAGLLELRLDPATAKALNGYDFLTLAIENRSSLDDWVARLDALGVEHSPPIVALVGWLLVVADPDGLRLRFYTTEPHRLGESAVEFDSPWLGTGPTAEPADGDSTIVCNIGRLTALPSHGDDVASLMHWVAEATRHEDGCLAYQVHRSEADPNTTVVYESWTSPAALAAHHETAHMAAFQEAAGSLVEWPPQMELLTPVA